MNKFLIFLNNCIFFTFRWVFNSIPSGNQRHLNYYQLILLLFLVVLRYVIARFFVLRRVFFSLSVSYSVCRRVKFYFTHSFLSTIAQSFLSLSRSPLYVDGTGALKASTFFFLSTNRIILCIRLYFLRFFFLFFFLHLTQTTNDFYPCFKHFTGQKKKKSYRIDLLSCFHYSFYLHCVTSYKTYTYQ